LIQSLIPSFIRWLARASILRGFQLNRPNLSLHPSPVIARNEAIQRPWCTIGHRTKAWIATALRASQ
jgi:hypothetical protein